MSTHIEDTNYVSPHVAERSRRMFVRTVDRNTYIVTPKQRDKRRRKVSLSKDDKGQVVINCEDYLTGEECPANYWKHHCAHVESALKRLLANVKRADSKKLKQYVTKPPKHTPRSNNHATRQ